MRHRSSVREARPLPDRTSQKAALARRVSSQGALQRTACACGGGCPRCQAKTPLQTPLQVSQPGDTSEREADGMAERVLRMPQSGRARVAGAPTPVADAALPSELSAHLDGDGAPLDGTTRGFFEPRFGADLSAVRVHAGASAARLAGGYGAHAFAWGNHIVFNAGKYAPHTRAGRSLMAHELAHVEQQRRTPALARRIMRACDAKTTGVAVPTTMIDDARATALSAVKAARAAFKGMKSSTITLLDRHFHCPSTTNMIEVKKVLEAIEGRLPGVGFDCLPDTDAECAGGGFGAANDKTGDLSACPPWFTGMTNIQRAVTFIFAAAIGLGRRQRCRRSEGCYDDYTQNAAAMLQNPYSFAWFVVEAAKLSAPDGRIVPCRPQGSGIYYVVSPAARKDPWQIRRLSGFDPIPRGSDIVELHSDSSGKDFIYHDDIEGARRFLPDDPMKRYYFPDGRL